MPLYKIGEAERVQYEGQFLPNLPHMEKGREGSFPSCLPSVDVAGLPTFRDINDFLLDFILMSFSEFF